jgi:P27 family predicted phage terminase small subunit
LEGGEVNHRPSPEPLTIAGRAIDMIEPPKWLAKDAKAYWRETVAKLIDVGMIDLVDAAALEVLASSYARWRQAGRTVNRVGLLVPGRQGGMVLNPAVRAERDAATLHLKVAEHFGLTALARARLGLAEVHRRSLQGEMDRALDGGTVDGEAEVVEDGDEDVGLPGTVGDGDSG